MSEFEPQNQFDPEKGANLDQPASADEEAAGEGLPPREIDQSFKPPEEQMKRLREESDDLYLNLEQKQRDQKQYEDKLAAVQTDESLSPHERELKIAFYTGKIDYCKEDQQRILRILRLRQQMNQFD